jgi:hypothetical protein
MKNPKHGTQIYLRERGCHDWHGKWNIAWVVRIYRGLTSGYVPGLGYGERLVRFVDVWTADSEISLEKYYPQPLVTQCRLRECPGCGTAYADRATHKEYRPLCPPCARARPKQRRHEKSGIVVPTTCQWCGGSLQAARVGQRYCSGRCRVAAHRAAGGYRRWSPAQARNALMPLDFLGGLA